MPAKMPDFATKTLDSTAASTKISGSAKFDSGDFADSAEIAALKSLLDAHYEARNRYDELILTRPDPLFVLKKHQDSPHLDETALICALLSYGSAAQILKTLLFLDFSLLGRGSAAILRADFPKYRFQSALDIKMLFLAVSELITRGGAKKIFVESYAPKHCVLSGINALIRALRGILMEKLAPQNAANAAANPARGGANLAANPKNNAENPANPPKDSPPKTKNPPHDLADSAQQSPQDSPLSHGLDFLIGRESNFSPAGSPLKRWNMFLRWMVRRDCIDLGRWEGAVSAADLILPLDTHTFNVSRKLGLLRRKSYDLGAALEITKNLATLCPSDPVKYDFAIYRIGQERLDLD